MNWRVGGDGDRGIVVGLFGYEACGDAAGASL